MFGYTQGNSTEIGVLTAIVNSLWNKATTDDEKEIAVLMINDSTKFGCEPVMLPLFIDGYAPPLMVKYFDTVANHQLPVPVAKMAQAVLEYKANITSKLYILDLFFRINLASKVLIDLSSHGVLSGTANSDETNEVNIKKTKKFFITISKMAGFSALSIYELRAIADEITQVECEWQQKCKGKFFLPSFNDVVQRAFNQLKICKQHIAFTLEYLHNRETGKRSGLGLPSIYYLVRDLYKIGILNDRTWSILREKLLSYFTSIIDVAVDDDGLPIKFSVLKQRLHQLYHDAHSVFKKFKNEAAIEKIVIEKNSKKKELYLIQNRINLLTLIINNVSVSNGANKVLMRQRRQRINRKQLLTTKQEQLQQELRRLFFAQEHIIRKIWEKYGVLELSDWTKRYLSHHHVNSNLKPITSNKLLRRLGAENNDYLKCGIGQIGEQLNKIKKGLFERNTNSDDLDQLLSSLPTVAMINKFAVCLIVEIIKEHYNYYYAMYPLNLGRLILNVTARLNAIKKYFCDVKIKDATLLCGDTIVQLSPSLEFSSIDLGNLIKDLNREKNNARGSHLAGILTTIKTSWEKYEKPYWYMLYAAYNKRIKLAKKGFDKISTKTENLIQVFKCSFTSCKTLKEKIKLLENILEKMGETEFKEVLVSLDIVNEKINRANGCLALLQQQLMSADKQNIKEILKEYSELQQKYENCKHFIKEEVVHFLRRSTQYLRQHRLDKLQLSIEKIIKNIRDISEAIIQLEKSGLQNYSLLELEQRLQQVHLERKKLTKLQCEAEAKLMRLNQEKAEVEHILWEKEVLQTKIRTLLATDDQEEIEHSLVIVGKIQDQIKTFDSIIHQVEQTRSTLSDVLNEVDIATVITRKLIQNAKIASEVHKEISAIANQVEQQLTQVQNITQDIKSIAIEYQEKVSDDLELLNDPEALLEVKLIKGSIAHLEKEKTVSARKKFNKLEELLDRFLETTVAKNYVAKQCILKKIHYQIDLLRLPSWMTLPLLAPVIRWFAAKILGKKTRSRMIYNQMSRELILIKNRVQNPDDKYQVVRELVTNDLRISWNIELEKKIKAAAELQVELLESYAKAQQQCNQLKKSVAIFGCTAEKYLYMVKLPFIILRTQVEIKNEQWQHLMKPSGLKQLWCEIKDESGFLCKLGNTILAPITTTAVCVLKDLAHAIVGDLVMIGCGMPMLAAVLAVQTTVAKIIVGLVPKSYLGKFAENAAYSAMKITWYTECANFNDKKDATKNIVKRSFLFREVVSGRFYLNWFKGFIALQENYESEAKRLESMHVDLMRELIGASDQLKSMSPYEFIGTREEVVKRHKMLMTKLAELDEQLTSTKKIYLIVTCHYKEALKTVYDFVANTPLLNDVINGMKDTLKNQQQVFGNEWLPEREKSKISKASEKLTIFTNFFTNIFTQYMESWTDDRSLIAKAKRLFTGQKVYPNAYQQMTEALLDTMSKVEKVIFNSMSFTVQQELKRELPKVKTGIIELQNKMKNIKPDSMGSNSTTAMNEVFKFIEPQNFVQVPKKPRVGENATLKQGPAYFFEKIETFDSSNEMTINSKCTS